MLKVDLIGRIGKDAEIKNINGKSYIAFNVATSEYYKDANGNKVERTTWVSCLKPGDTTSPVIAYLLKGTQVFVRGDLTVKPYTNAQGIQAGVNCKVQELQLLGSRSDTTQQSAATPGTSGGYGYPQPGAYAQPGDPFGGNPSEDIPY